MKHEPRPATHMGKVMVSWLTEWVGQSLWGSPLWDSVSQVDGVSDIAHVSWLCGSVGEGLEKGQWPLPTFLPGRKLSPSSHFDARYLISSFYAAGAFQAAALVLELRGSESE